MGDGKQQLAVAADDPRMQWLVRHESWLKVLAGAEIGRRLQGKVSASDAVQQTLLAAWRDWEQCHGEDDPQRRGWLRQILAHVLAHEFRRYQGAAKRDVARELSIDEHLAQTSVRLGGMLAAPEPSPSQHALAREREIELANALARLPDDYREVIVLRNLEELSHEEVAARMNRSPSAVRMLWVRALQRLKSELAQA